MPDLGLTFCDLLSDSTVCFSGFSRISAKTKTFITTNHSIMDQDEDRVEDSTFDTDDDEVEDENEGDAVSDAGDGSAEDEEEEVAETIMHDDDEDEEDEQEDDLGGEEEDKDEEEEVGDEEEEVNDEEEEEAAVEGVVEANGDDEDDDEGEEVLAAVIIEDEPIAATEEVEDTDAQPTVEIEKVYKAKPVAKKSKPSSAGKKKKAGTSKVTLPANGLRMDVRPENLEAAKDARATLRDMVQSLPMPFGDIQVRSFGRIHLESDKSGKEAKFSSTGSIYPVGFSCDRFEFSPVHGRVLKMRCTILDGKRIKQLQREKSFPVTDRLADGPVFRVVWGQGIDEENDDDLGPFDPELDAPLIDTSKKITANSMRPKVGMQVRVRFGKNQTYGGVITGVGDVYPSTKESQRKGLTLNQDITINYDDGFSETISYPDADVALVVPGKSKSIVSSGLSNDFNLLLQEWNMKLTLKVMPNLWSGVANELPQLWQIRHWKLGGTYL
jgi:hypothetical protein